MADARPGRAWDTGHPIVLKDLEGSYFRRATAARAAGLTCGIAMTMRELKPECRLFASEVAGAAPLAASLAAGSPQVVDYQPSFVDGIGSKTVFPQMFERARALIDGSLVASVEEVAAAVRLVAERNRVIAEGAGACPVACALSGKAGGGKIVCIVSGGNIDLHKLCATFGQQSSGTKS